MPVKLRMLPAKTMAFAPLVRLITFTLKDGDETKSDAWTTSCASITGDFAGQSSAVIQLLLDQIPGSRDAIGAVK